MRAQNTICFSGMVFTLGVIFWAAPSASEPFAQPTVLASNEIKSLEPDTDLFAIMSGICTTLKMAGRDFTCKAVAIFHSNQGRTNFTVALDDPADNTHIISFSGADGQRQADLYELPIDRMLLSSKDRPKVDGLPVPFVELSEGSCKQLGNLATGQVYTISCSATDSFGKSYELQFETDGSPVTVRKVRLSPPTIRQNQLVESNLAQGLVEPNSVAPEYREAAEKRRAEQVAQLECRQKSVNAKVLPRDRTAYVIQCLDEFGKPVTGR